jgi:hypothetical protein
MDEVQKPNSSRSLTVPEHQLSELIVSLTASILLAMEQRVNTTLCFKLGRTAMTTRGVLRTGCGNKASRRGSTFEWFKRNSDALKDLQDDPRNEERNFSKCEQNHKYPRNGDVRLSTDSQCRRMN